MKESPKNPAFSWIRNFGRPLTRRAAYCTLQGAQGREWGGGKDLVACTTDWQGSGGGERGRQCCTADLILELSLSLKKEGAREIAYGLIAAVRSYTDPSLS